MTPRFLSFSNWMGGDAIQTDRENLGWEKYVAGAETRVNLLTF